MSNSQQGWYRLNKEQAHAVLAKLSSHRDAIVFSKEATEVSWRPLTFYGRFKVYRLVNYATMPTFSMNYLSDDQEFITLDGTANPVYTVNEKDPIQLTRENVLSYIEFFFKNVQGSEGEVVLIKDPRRLPFADILSDAQRATLQRGFKPVVIKADSEQGLNITATMYYGGAIILSSILVAPDGHLSFLDQNLLVTGIHLPDTPFDQPSWAEG
jgi:hypothetical protein